MMFSIGLGFKNDYSAGLLQRLVKHLDTACDWRCRQYFLLSEGYVDLCTPIFVSFHTIIHIRIFAITSFVHLIILTFIEIKWAPRLQTFKYVNIFNLKEASFDVISRKWTFVPYSNMNLRICRAPVFWSRWWLSTIYFSSLHLKEYIRSFSLDVMRNCMSETTGLPCNHGLVDRTCWTNFEVLICMLVNRQALEG